MLQLPKMASLPDFRDYAMKTMSQRMFNELDDAAGNQISKQLNESDFNVIKLKQRGMANMKYFNGTQAKILGHNVSLPLGLAAIPKQARFHIDGELASAHAAKEMGLIYTLDAARASKPMQEILEASQGGLKLVRLCPYMPTDTKTKALKVIATQKDIIGVVLDFNTDAKIDSQTLSKITAKIPTTTWKATDIQYIKESTQKPVVVQGIMCIEDALQAVQAGADALWISNSGGRALDTLPSTISVLHAISKAVKSLNPKVEIYIDGGVRRGIDVLKCLALGASMVFMGRPVAWGLHYSGQEGVQYMVNTIADEFKTAMILTHSMDVGEITEEKVIHKLYHDQERPRL